MERGASTSQAYSDGASALPTPIYIQPHALSVDSIALDSDYSDAEEDIDVGFKRKDIIKRSEVGRLLHEAEVRSI